LQIPAVIGIKWRITFVSNWMCIDNYDFMFIRDNAFVKMLQKIILLSYNQSMN